MDDLQTARDLRGAAAYLRKHGWIQGELGKDGGPRCMGGAIKKEAFEACALAMGLRFYGATEIPWPIDPITHQASGSVPDWNDAPERTVDEVLDRLESTALALEIRALAATKTAEPVPEPVLA